MPKPEKSKKPKVAKDPEGPPRGLAERAERARKDVDRVLKKHPDMSPEEQAMAHLEQAKVSALLQLGEAIRESRRAEGRPPA